ncbi:MAG: hypothetical protein AMXMBFR82_23170 [Candidatus Hydrogenedentota bacterium]
MADIHDKREFTRVHTDLDAKLLQPGRPPVSCHLEDLSMNGALVAAQGEVADGTTCTMELLLPGADPPVRIVAKGTVTRLEANMVAVAFEEIDEESFVHLRKLVLVNADDPARVEDELDSSVGIRRQQTDF